MCQQETATKPAEIAGAPSEVQENEQRSPDFLQAGSCSAPLLCRALQARFLSQNVLEVHRRAPLSIPVVPPLGAIVGLDCAGLYNPGGARALDFGKPR
jgi:hypothetical protein